MIEETAKEIEYRWPAIPPTSVAALAVTFGILSLTAAATVAFIAVPHGSDPLFWQSSGGVLAAALFWLFLFCITVLVLVFVFGSRRSRLTINSHGIWIRRGWGEESIVPWAARPELSIYSSTTRPTVGSTGNGPIVTPPETQKWCVVAVPDMLVAHVEGGMAIPARIEHLQSSGKRFVAAVLLTTRFPQPAEIVAKYERVRAEADPSA